MVTNSKKVIDIEGVRGTISIKLYKSCMVGHQKLEIFWMLIPKAAKFLSRLYIDIKGPLLIISWTFNIFFLIKIMLGNILCAINKD